jgi:hypothetical protein
MSRNLSTRCCYFCGGAVTLEEEPRSLTKKEAGVYWERRDGYSYQGAIMANACCEDCNAKYLAWIDLSQCPGYQQYPYFHTLSEGEKFFDLSFRHSFNDEPDPEDMPDFIIEAKTQRVLVNKGPWPLCPGGCGLKTTYLENPKIAYCYKCRENKEKVLNYEI